ASLRTETPSTRTSPSLGARIPPMIRLAVVLPAPFGPRSATISPGWTWNETSSSANVPSKLRERRVTSITLRAYERYELAFDVGGRRHSLASRSHGVGTRLLLHGRRAARRLPLLQRRWIGAHVPGRAALGRAILHVAERGRHVRSRRLRGLQRRARCHPGGPRDDARGPRWRGPRRAGAVGDRWPEHACRRPRDTAPFDHPHHA